MKSLLSRSAIIKFALAIGVVSALTACIQTPNWTLFYVADQQPMPTQMVKQQFIKGYYDSIEHCQAKGRGLLKLNASSVEPQQAYICGQMCVADEKTGEIACQNLIPGSKHDEL
ncbi:hypothetical protein ACFOD0_09060 [Shewanella intestini]|uniref:Lipoprotein n=1 Tax=Shewanella intestini TaxID=2017544 RepID=A0ABS5I2E8_9GAMM|nr:MULTISPECIES: hypothetical protein [Shewanella]MBR9728169.1 hypothetical protein [Shewanella intestini]MRG36640.1 hypothetical protein [Shewanella sp. XMDDZSB0408]